MASGNEKENTIRTSFPDFSVYITYYGIDLSGPNDEFIAITAYDDGLINIDDLAPGEWIIEVTAYNEDDLPLGTGSNIVDIVAQENTECDIIVTPFSGQGQLILTIDWDNTIIETPVIRGNLEHSNPEIQITEFELIDSENIYDNDSLTSGYYTLTINLYDNDDNELGGAADVMRIIAEQETQVNIYIEINLPLTEPAAPDNLTAIAINYNKVNLTWSDNSYNEDGFRIERATDDGGSPGIYNEIASLSGNSTSYSDSGLSESTKYYYRVCAFNSLGDSSYSNIADVTTPEIGSGPIIADHTVVDRYDDIPQQYIDEVKKMYLNIPGESHSTGYRKGLDLLMQLDPTFQAVTTESDPPEPYREDALRADGLVRSNQYDDWHTGAGESRWYTWHAWDPLDPEYPAIEADKIKHHISYCNDNDLEIAAIGFGWCWDMTWTNAPGGDIDPVYNVHWAGSSVGGPDGNMRWGLDDDDTDLTGNSVNMNDYLEATEEYISHVVTNGYNTVVFFTTGPVDGYTGENGYQRYIKHEYIRNHVNNNANYVLFDYADILTHNNDGEQNILDWDGNSYPYIHSDNRLDYDDDWNTITATEDGDHIGEVGALRLGKAVWWVLARLAGWDGVSSD